MSRMFCYNFTLVSRIILLDGYMDCLYNDSAPAHVGIHTCNQNLCNYFSIYILYVYVFACTM